jgi:hypothetical protein
MLRNQEAADNEPDHAVEQHALTCRNLDLLYT